MIEIKNVSKKFADQFVLKDINLNIDDGEQVLFVGQNGADADDSRRIHTHKRQRSYRWI